HNEVLIEVRYRSDALYTPNRISSKYHNPEPRSYILNDDGFDPLAYTLERAHSLGIKVQAWVIVFNATPLDPKLVSQNYLYRTRHEWFTYDQDGVQMNTPEQFGYFIDPGIPEVQEYLLDVFSDIVEGYPELDGLHLDYIRYPNARWGFHPTSLDRYNRYVAEQQSISWNDWRIKQVTQFVEACSTRIKQINPRIMLSAAVFSSIFDARTAYAQDWYDWLSRGLLDRVYPMAYTLDYAAFQNQLQDMKTLSRDKDIVIGLRAWDASGRSLMPWDSPEYNITHINRRIDYLRVCGFGGTALFSYDGLKAGNALYHLANLAYQDAGTPEPEPVPVLAADAVFSAHPGKYYIDLIIPSEGRWNWVLKDANETGLFARARYYLQGENRDFWDAIDTEGNPVSP
ncbi:MAG TPA: family 10 glycosylhydrolase, partial [Candidatus Cloacimonadota bacterium]|nr:family 10 glycosylhydrolase [Candidatus Cloacimonadota bacterium]